MKDFPTWAKNLVGGIVVLGGAWTWTEEHFVTQAEYRRTTEKIAVLEEKAEKQSALAVTVGVLVAVIQARTPGFTFPGGPAQAAPPVPERKQEPDVDELTRQVEEIVRRECERLPRPECTPVERPDEKAKR